MDVVMQQLHSIDAHCGHAGSVSGVMKSGKMRGMINFLCIYLPGSYLHTTSRAQ